MAEILYGRKPILESLRAGRRRARRILLAEASEEQATLREILALARQKGVPVKKLPKQELGRRAGHHHHQGLLLETGSYPYAEMAQMLGRAEATGEAPLLLILDLLQDPQNVGSLLRTAFDDRDQLLPPQNGEHKDIHTDLYAIQCDRSGDRIRLIETENPLLPDSHCDVAYSGALARKAASLESATPHVSVAA